MKNKNLLIYSGGLDSTSLLYAHKHEIGLAVSFDYGSRHNAKEIACAKNNCSILNINHIVIPIKDVMAHMTSSLLGHSPVPHGHYADETMKSTVVPFRNGIMLSIATGIADSHGLGGVMIASHAGDHAVYPDCTAGFNLGMSMAMEDGTYGNISLYAPFQNKTKKEVASIGVAFGMKPHYTYSCYEGGDIHCGLCSTCQERQWSLEGLDDITAYMDNKTWKETLKDER